METYPTTPMPSIVNEQILAKTRGMQPPEEDGTEERQNVWGDQIFKSVFELIYPPMSNTEVELLLAFWKLRNGAFEEFTYAHKRTSTNYTVRFLDSVFEINLVVQSATAGKKKISSQTNKVGAVIMRDIPSAIAGIVAGNNTPYDLYTISLDDLTLRYTSHSSDVTFPTGGDTFISKNITHTNIKMDINTGIPNTNILINDADGYLSSLYVDNRYEFRDKDVTIKTVYEGYLGNADYYVELFGGIIVKPEFQDNYKMMLQLKSILSSLNIRIPQNDFLPTCPWVFGDDNCSPDTTLKRTYTGSVIQNYIWIDDPNMRDIPGYEPYEIPQEPARNHFKIRIDEEYRIIVNQNQQRYNNGYITFDSGANQNFRRRINKTTITDTEKYEEVELTLYDPLNSDVGVGDRITIETGCDKTKTVCNETHNNIENYGGILFAVRDWWGRNLVLVT